MAMHEERFNDGRGGKEKIESSNSSYTAFPFPSLFIASFAALRWGGGWVVGGGGVCEGTEEEQRLGGGAKAAACSSPDQT